MMINATQYGRITPEAGIKIVTALRKEIPAVDP
jgi:hypothetical protein